jgi:hypothetical protein
MTKNRDVKPFIKQKDGNNQFIIKQLELQSY